MKPMKYRVYIYVDGDCSGCNKKEKWFYFGITYNPVEFRKEHPGFQFKIEEAILK